MKITRLFLAIITITFASCDPYGFDSAANLDVNGLADGTFDVTLADGSMITACNSTTWQLNAGNTFKNAGFVNVSNDNTNLYVTVNSTFGFQSGSENLKIWVGTNLDLLPSNTQGVAIPGQFPLKTTLASGVNEYTFIIPFTAIEGYGGITDCTSKIYVFVHGDVISDANGGTDTAWGGNSCTQSGTDGNKRWICSGVYQAKCCTPPPPSGYTQTAFAKGSWVFTSDKKSNPENLSSLNLTKNRWGWAINVKATGTTSYSIYAGAGLNNISKGKKVGTLNVDWNGSSVTVTYTMLPGYSMEGVHVYAGDFKPTTIAPGQYGNQASFDPNATTYTETYTVSDSNADGIWIIAHAGVYGNY